MMPICAKTLQRNSAGFLLNVINRLLRDRETVTPTIDRPKSCALDRPVNVFFSVLR